MMGTWDVNAFGNDDAADWALNLAKAKDLSPVELALDKAISAENSYLEAPDAVEALAAVEVVTRLQGNWGARSAYSEPADDWVEANKFPVSGALARKALQVLNLVVKSNSELKELWQESPDYQAWLASLKEIKSRIQF